MVPQGRTKLWYLSHFSLFREFSQEELQAIQSHLVLDELPKGATIFSAGEPATSVYFLKSGLVEISRLSRGGKKLILALLKAGEVFGHLSTIAERERPHTAETREPSLLCSMGAGSFRSLLESRPRLGLTLMKQIGEEVVTLENAIESLVFKGVAARLAETLLRLVQAFGAPGPHGVALRVALTQQDLAGLIGASRQHVNIALNQLRRKGLVQRQDGTLWVRNQERLRRIAESEAR